MKLIGICTSNEHEKTGDMIMDIIGSRADKVQLYKSTDEYRKKTSEHGYGVLYLTPYCTLRDVRLDILVQSSESRKSMAQRAIRCIRPGGYIILNSDTISKIDIKCRDVYTVSYGLNSRATVTASSIDDVQGLSFCYYLQRSVPIMDGGTLQPFETPVTLQECKDIHSCLAAYTCALILGFKMQ